MEESFGRIRCFVVHSPDFNPHLGDDFSGCLSGNLELVDPAATPTLPADLTSGRHLETPINGVPKTAIQAGRLTSDDKTTLYRTTRSGCGPFYQTQDSVLTRRIHHASVETQRHRSASFPDVLRPQTRPTLPVLKPLATIIGCWTNRAFCANSSVSCARSKVRWHPKSPGWHVMARYLWLWADNCARYPTHSLSSSPSHSSPSLFFPAACPDRSLSKFVSFLLVPTAHTHT